MAKISLYDLYVSYSIGSGIDEVFTTKEEAVLKNEEKNDIYEKSGCTFRGKLGPYRVMSLDDAICEETANAREDAIQNERDNEPYY